MNVLKSISSALANEAISKLVSGNISYPQVLLGPHSLGDTDRVAVRAFLPQADEAWIVNESQSVAQPMTRVNNSGLFESICSSQIFNTTLGKYQFRYTQGNKIMSVHDPYAFEPLLTDLDLHLFNEGNHFEIYVWHGVPASIS